MLKRLLNKFYNISSVYFFQKSQNQWYEDPIKPNKRVDKGYFISLHQKAKRNTNAEINNLETQIGYSIDQKWLHELALITQITKKDSEINYQHGRLLYSVLKNYLDLHRNNQYPINILETGTARGFSALCMAKALNEGGKIGRIFSFDVLPHFTPMYWNNITDMDGKLDRKSLLSKWEDLINKYIIFIQGNTKIMLGRIQLPRINFAFLDGAHTYEDVMFEFGKIKNRQMKGDVIVFDDYNPYQFKGLVKAVDQICEEYNYQRKNIVTNSDRGYVIASKK